jgi:CubicO group peptidase (beta-lactamase class C family)
MKSATRVGCVAGGLVVATMVLSAAGGGSLTVTKPEDVGFSTERLQRIHETIQRHLDDRDVAGAVTLVARCGRIAHVEAHGYRDVAAKKPMSRDAIFRLASMSKPITAVAVLMLFEEGKLRLNDPVSKFIPEFHNPKVAVANYEPSAAAPGNRAGDEHQAVRLVPASREITIRDLLTHTSGLLSRGPGEAAARLAPRKPTETLADYIPRLAAAPLDFQPGTWWSYSPAAGIDVLGRVVEVVSGQTFDRFLEQRLFDPLGMKDTGFTLTDSRTARLVPLYRKTAGGLEKTSGDAAGVDTVYFSGAGGLLSTADDYLQFAQMLVNGGQMNGRRFLSPKTVELMGSNHVGDLYAAGCAHQTLGPCDFYDQRGMGFGLGVDVVRDPVAAGIGVSAGSFGWAGAFGTRMWVDPKEQMVTILMVSTRVVQVQRDFEYAVRQALVE